MLNFTDKEIIEKVFIEAEYPQVLKNDSSASNDELADLDSVIDKAADLMNALSNSKLKEMRKILKRTNIQVIQALADHLEDIIEDGDDEDGEYRFMLQVINNDVEQR